MSRSLLQNGKLSKSKTDANHTENLIRSMLKKHRSPLMLIRESVLKKQFMLFKKHLPEVTPYYAIKANANPDIIKTFVKLGAGFDVASAWEMKHVLALGASPEKIVFANTIKTDEDIITARRRRVKLVTFDSEPELYKLSLIASYAFHAHPRERFEEAICALQETPA